jgi:hypothetical protein
MEKLTLKARFMFAVYRKVIEINCDQVPSRIKMIITRSAIMYHEMSKALVWI